MELIDFLDHHISLVFNQLTHANLSCDTNTLKSTILEKLNNNNVKRLFNCYKLVPDSPQKFFNIDNGVVTVETIDSLSEEILLASLKAFIPWRKGPFKINSVLIDTEWNSYLKWNRFKDHIYLDNKTVLDVGCGSGYHLYLFNQMGAKFTLGIDPFELFYFQYLVIKKFIQNPSISFLPIGWQSLDNFMSPFDFISCMGILYHHRDPLQLLTKLYNLLAPSGELLIETLIIPTSNNDILIPQGRYANMRNVYSIPSEKRLHQTILAAGFNRALTLDITKTTPKEQRATEWSNNFSLINNLDPTNFNKTVEGYPAPTRICVLAYK
ncbi:tRNA 5-methoxyuridine(34)/uridine 5-oxyacetic acid(34) synthase CmoB [Candidatus Marinamargulisbacteria bacterium SCGC AG-414-C22]|nr:tRNA 5-methoxyuridine(34)/uridine 5-oxyacetic acid(34) synthase CmoB [Candidatus Marinamargulisbacteria bacterium SCGC AG-414-C22]